MPALKDPKAYNLRQKALVEALISNTDWREIAPALTKHLDPVALLEIARSLIRAAVTELKPSRNQNKEVEEEVGDA